MVDKINLAGFKDAVLKSASAEKSALIDKYNEMKKLKFSEIENGILSKAYTAIQKDIDAIRNEYRAKIAAAEQDARKKLIEKRLSIEEKVFEKATVNILAFTESPAYKDFLVKKAEEIKTDLPSCDGMKILLRAKDMVYKSELENIISSAKAEECETIKLGGFIINAAEKNMRFDCTLDSLLKEQRKHFLTTANIQVD